MSRFASDELTIATAIQKSTRNLSSCKLLIESYVGLLSAQVLKSNPLQLIRDLLTRWSDTFNMLEHAMCLRTPIDLWTRSNIKYEKLGLSDKE